MNQLYNLSTFDFTILAIMFFSVIYCVIGMTIYTLCDIYERSQFREDRERKQFIKKMRARYLS